MSRRGSKNKLAHTDLALGTMVVPIALLLAGLVLLRSKSARSMAPQRFPIDGMAAEWRSDQRGRKYLQLLAFQHGWPETSYLAGACW
jgi:hypothetical protein